MGKVNKGKSTKEEVEKESNTDNIKIYCDRAIDDIYNMAKQETKKGSDVSLSIDILYDIILNLSKQVKQLETKNQELESTVKEEDISSAPVEKENIVLNVTLNKGHIDLINKHVEAIQDLLESDDLVQVNDEPLKVYITEKDITSKRKFPDFKRI